MTILYAFIIAPLCTFLNYDVSFDRVQAVSTKRPENILLKRPPVSRASSSQEGLSELAPEPVSRVKNTLSMIPSEGMIY